MIILLTGFGRKFVACDCQKIPRAYDAVERIEGIGLDAKTDIPADVAAAFEALPDDVRPRLLELRQLLFDVAAQTDGVGEIVETLKWGQPSYLTVRPKSGSTVRLGVSKDGRPALFCHCQTTLVGEYRNLYHAAFDFEGNRAVVLKENATLPVAELQHCIALALTYHRRK